MDITITIPTNQVSRVVAAIKGVYPKGDSELSDAQWGKFQIIEFLKRTVQRYERKQAIDDIVIDSVDNLTTSPELEESSSSSSSSIDDI